MNAPATDHWSDLFAPVTPGESAVKVRLRIVRRGDTPFLFLPATPALAAQALALYPAQTTKARLAKSVLGLALRCGLSPLREWMEIEVSVKDPFAVFLTRMADTKNLPSFAVLAGNPQTPGRRFIFLLFGANGQPAAVIKAGVTPAAHQLLAAEAGFLKGKRTGLPQLRASFLAGQRQAFALDYLAGHSPSPSDLQPLAKILNDWLLPEALLPLKQLPGWQRLQAALPDGLPPVVQTLGESAVHPALFHGDLAPWNIKVAGGKWTVLDWERGEAQGVPGWDWLHFVLQPALLVTRESPTALFQRLDQTLNSPLFVDYARRARLEGNERSCALAYVLYCRHVLRPTEGQQALVALEKILAEKWFPSPR